MMHKVSNIVLSQHHQGETSKSLIARKCLAFVLSEPVPVLPRTGKYRRNSRIGTHSGADLTWH